MKLLLNAVLFTCFVWSCGLAANAQDPTVETKQKIKIACQSIIERLHENGDFTGASASIVLPDNHVITICVGKAFDKEHTPITPESRMSSGSIGKTYFAALAMKLVEEGKLSLDDRLSKYLGDQKWFDRLPNAHHITLRHLLTHQSGVPRYIFNKEIWRTAIDDPNKKWTGVEQIKYVFDQKPVHPAGKGWAYSDTGFILLALAIEKVSNGSLVEQIDRVFLKPNKLNDTVAAQRGKINNLVSGRCRLLKQFGIPEQPVVDQQFQFNPTFEWAGGGYVCTSSDLARWANIFWSGKAIEGDYVDALIKDAPSSAPFLGQNSRYGIGTMIRPTELGISYGHDGVFTGYLSSTAYFPEHDISVAIQLTTDRPQDVGKPLHTVLVDFAKTAASAK